MDLLNPPPFSNKKERRRVVGCLLPVYNGSGPVYTLYEFTEFTTNQAEWVNRGGDDVIPETNPQVTRVSHGNTMTAAAVVTNVIQICGAKGLRNQVLLTGSTSKVGQAVALYLAHHGFEVVCYTKSDQRFAELKQRFSPNSRGGKLVRADEFAQGSAVRLWIIGKWQPQVHDHIPHKGEVVVFSVPDPMDPGRRPDLNITDGKEQWMDGHMREPACYGMPLLLAGLACHICLCLSVVCLCVV